MRACHALWFEYAAPFHSQVVARHLRFTPPAVFCCLQKSLPCGGSAGEFAVRVVQDKMGEEYAAKSFALVAAPKDGSMEKDTFGRSDDNQHSELPPAVGLHMADVSYVANEISFQRALATQTLGLVVPVQGWFLEVIKRAGYCVLCITMVMPFTGYDLLVCKRLLVSSPMVSVYLRRMSHNAAYAKQQSAECVAVRHGLLSVRCSLCSSHLLCMSAFCPSTSLAIPVAICL